MKNLLLFSLLFILIVGCEKKLTTYEKDDLEIREYLEKNNIQATKHSSGLYYVIEKEGNGNFPTLSNNVEVKYMAYTVDGDTLDPGTNPYITPLSSTSLYAGWKYGLPLFSEGGKGNLFLPRSLANGQQVVLFNIELRKVF